MDIVKAAEGTLKAVEDSCGAVNVTRHYDDPTNLNHVRWMLEGIITEYIQHEKAHRWLGWAQACICQKGIATMGELAQINKDS